MARFFEAPDAYGDPCLWENRDNGQPMLVLAKYDFEPEFREAMWPCVVQAVTSA